VFPEILYRGRCIRDTKVGAITRTDELPACTAMNKGQKFALILLSTVVITAEHNRTRQRDTTTHETVWLDGIEYPCTDIGVAAAAEKLSSGGVLHMEGCSTISWAKSQTFGSNRGPGITLTYDPAKTRINISESDGGCPVRLGNGSGVMGIGGGQISGADTSSDAGFWLAASANVEGLFCNSDDSGAQEDAFLDRVIAGSVTSPHPASVNKGLVYFKQLATNTYIMNSNFVACPGAAFGWRTSAGKRKSRTTG
jgi:hypothetical protein